LPVDSKPRKFPRSRICAVEETGIYSVSPSTTPRITAPTIVCSLISRLRDPGKEGLLVRKLLSAYRSSHPCARLKTGSRLNCAALKRPERSVLHEAMLTLFHHPLFANCRFVRVSFGE